jgi:hypothetical protein
MRAGGFGQVRHIRTGNTGQLHKPFSTKRKKKGELSRAVRACMRATGQDPRPRHRTCRAHARRTETRDDDLRLASGRPDLRLAVEGTESALWEKSSVEGETVISAVK